MKRLLSKGRSTETKAPSQTTKKPALKNSNLEQKSSTDKQPTKKKKGAAVERNPSKNADMVTLTQSEFDVIMQTIGKLAMDSEKISTDKLAFLPATYERTFKETSHQLPSKAEAHEFRSLADDQHKQNLPQAMENPLARIPKAHLTLAEKKRLEWQQQSGFTEAGWYNQDNVQTIRSDPQALQAPRGQQTLARMEEQVHPSPLFLTATEKKKLQWEKERAELSALNKFDPWGRAGAGAPIKDQYGNVVNDYVRRQEVLLNSRNWPAAEPGSKFTAVDPVSYLSSQHYPLQKSQSHPEQIDSVASGAPVSKATMIKPFHPGTLALDENSLLSEKERQKQAWLEDLEKQREELRQRKLTEKKSRQSVSPERYYWADRELVVNQAADGGQYQKELFAARDQKMALQLNESMNESRREEGQGEAFSRHSAPQLNGPGVTNASSQNQYAGENSTYLRGQNSMVDPITRQEQEEKRRKYLELQDFNRKQMEEREQKRKEEKEQRMLEDLEQERKFSQSMQIKQPTNQLATQPKPAKETMAPMDREAQERQREEMLRQGLEAARLEAEREKKLRLLEKLKKGNHDVSHLEAKLALHKVSDGAGVTHRSAVVDAAKNSRVLAPNHVEPQYVPGLGQLPGSEPNHVDTYREGFMENLSNSMQSDDKPLREFGTQTELSKPDTRALSRESTEAEYRPLAHKSHHDLSKRVRVISTPKQEQRKKQHVYAVASKSSHQQRQRPIWGYRNTEQKKPVTQSERDAFHGTRTRRQRRLDRQNELLGMMARNASHVPDYRVPIAARARSRSHESYAEEPPPRLDRAWELGKNASHRSRSQSRSPEPVQSHSNRNRSSRVPSPPVPSVRHRTDTSKDVDKYHDVTSVGASSHTNFVPFIRSSNVLNPVHAESPLPVSREPSEMEKARRAYQGVLNPAKYGQKMDADGRNNRQRQMNKDPLLNPSLVTDHPTHRQGQILQQLSTLRQALKEKQREMSSIPEAPDHHPEKYRGGRIISPTYD